MDRIIVKKFKEDEIVIRQGECVNCLYKVISGNFALYINYGTKSEYLVGIVSAPNFFGEMSAVAGQTGNYTVVAVNEASALCVPESSFDDFVEKNPQNAAALIKTMAKNISMLNMNMRMLTEEITEICNADKIDDDAVKKFAERYSNYNNKIIPMFFDVKI
ncbi:MAG: cyclic nucleotide-binding domain-containing protein [Ruminococcus sp.]|nr:cyclic nucleotide-binding domain-containing protein [Ruminococcus sp.]